jgi:uncharacterized membrane protein
MGFWTLATFVAAVVLWLVGWAISGPNAMTSTWEWGVQGMGPGMMPALLRGPGAWLMGLSMVLFWVAVILGIAALVGRRTIPSDARADDPDAVEIARRRYARGEITAEAYARLHDDLVGTGSSR